MDAQLSQPLISNLQIGGLETQAQKNEKPNAGAVPEWLLDETETLENGPEINTIYKKSPETPPVEKKPEQETKNVSTITDSIKPTPTTPKKPEKTGFNKVTQDSDPKHQRYDQEEEVILKGFAKEDSLKEQITSTI